MGMVGLHTLTPVWCGPFWGGPGLVDWGATPPVLAVELDADARLGAHLAQRVALLANHLLVALLREGHLHLTLGLRRRSSSPLGQPVLPPLKVSLSSVSGILDRGLLRSCPDRVRPRYDPSGRAKPRQP